MFTIFSISLILERTSYHCSGLFLTTNASGIGLIDTIMVGLTGEDVIIVVFTGGQCGFWIHTGFGGYCAAGWDGIFWLGESKDRCKQWSDLLLMKCFLIHLLCTY